MSGAHFLANGTSLFYTLEGPPTAAPILLIHGWGCDLLDWSFQIPFLLALGFQVLALDLRGHGRSPAYPSPTAFPSLYSPTAFAADASALLSHLNFTQPALVMGHSLGGLVAAILAIEHPAQVRGAVLVDSAYYLTANDTAALNADIRNDTAHALQTITTWFEAVVGVYDERTPEWEKTWHKLRTWGADVDAVVQTGLELNGYDGTLGRWEDAEGYLKEGFGARTGEERVPRLAVVAAEYKVDMEKAIGLDEAGVGDRVSVLEEGHWLHQQGAEQFNGIVESWFQDRAFLP
ncbi:Non-heme chloroperoxidase [Lasiodiplodia hormozganensis]|uniref:Non-heme chloroperoxidase n=1 Tax=Lasiodiplodia hormozganensis TaxID=869390 RepID=A0AA39XYI1_9PEZI|nr:Non-heme chloroperoxidase [Lasiodiplodia hormozganensis]